MSHKRAFIPLAVVALVVGGVVAVAHATVMAAGPVTAPTCTFPTTGSISERQALTYSQCRFDRVEALVSAPPVMVTNTVTATVTATETVTVAPTPSATASPTPTDPPPTGACAVTTPNVPDGPDGRGGCFPGTTNTGPNAAATTMPTYTGSCTITTANTVIDTMVVNCRTLDVRAAGLVLRNSYLNGGIVQSSGAAAFIVADSLIDSGLQYPACSDGSCPAGKYACGDPNNQTTDCGVTGSNFTITRTEIINSNRAAYCMSSCTITDSYFHGTNLWPDRSNLAHASSVREEQGLTLRHNSLHCSYTGPFVNGDIGCSADLTGYPDFTAINHNTVDRNLFVANTGNAYCAYGGGTPGKPYSNDPANATYQVFTDNVFQRGTNGRCGDFAPVDAFLTGRTGNVWSGNVWDDGTPAPAN